MKRKYAETLAMEYDFTTKEEYFNYIVESVVNGQRQQCRNLFAQMKGEDQQEFLIDYLQNDNGYQQSTKNICIAVLCK